MAIDELFTPGTVPNNHEIWPDCLEISFASLQAPAPGVQDDGAKSWSPKAASGGAADSTLFGHKSFQAIYRRIEGPALVCAPRHLPREGETLSTEAQANRSAASSDRERPSRRNRRP